MQSPSTKGVAYTPLPHGHDTHSRHASISTLVNEKTNSPGQPSPSKHSQSLARSALHRLLRILLITCLGCAYWFFLRSGNESIATPSGASDNAIPVSCSRDANFANPCLVERPFGLVLLAQMYNPDLGAIDPWMIHGLWGNFCNGIQLWRLVSPLHHNADQFQARIWLHVTQLVNTMTFPHSFGGTARTFF